MQCQHSLKSIFCITYLVVRLVITAPVFAATQSAQQPPTNQSSVDNGRAAIGRACAACHPNVLAIVQFQRKKEAGWRDSVYSMIGRGAHILPDEIEPIVAYLTANFGPNSPPPSPAALRPGGNRPGADGLEQRLPEASGKAVFVRACQQCHDLQTAVGKTSSPSDWKNTIDRMITLGARLSPQEQQQLNEYLPGLGQFREERKNQ